MSQTNLIFIGIHGTVLALDRATGQEVWRAKLKGSDFASVVLWQNPLKGLGVGLVTIAAPESQQTVVLHEKQRRDQAASSAVVI